MSHPIRRSHRPSLIHELGRILRARSGRSSWRTSFLTALLRRLGVRDGLRVLLHRFLPSVPEDPNRVDVVALLDHLHDEGVFRWYDDPLPLDKPTRDRLVELCASLLARPARPEMPPPVARELSALLEPELGPRADLVPVLEAVLVRHLWRSRGRERPLAIRIVRTAATRAPSVC